MPLRTAIELARDAGFLSSAADDIAAARNNHHEDGTMNTPRANPVWLTRPAYERLRIELATLRGKRSTSSDPNSTATTAESSAEYITDANRRHARIQQIQDILNHAVVGETPPDDGIVEPGMVLAVRFDDEDDTETFLLGTRAGETPADIEVYSPESPLGTALLGAREGDTRSYDAPNDTTVRVTLVRAVPYTPEASD